MQHLRHAVRLLLKNPGFTFFVVIILAFGIGANTAIFTLVSGALLKPLAYNDPSNLVLVHTVNGRQDTDGCLSYAHFSFLSEHNHAFQSMAGFTAETFALTNYGESVQLRAARVSANFFDVLGVKPTAGRTFLASEGAPAGMLVTILSDRFWRQRFGGDRSVIGRSLILDSKPYAIVGALPPSFQFAAVGNDIDLWTTQIDRLNIATPQQIQTGMCYLDSVARLGTGISSSQAQMQMNVLNSQFVREYPKLPDAHWVLQVSSLREHLVGDLRSPFLMLSAAVALVLLIACANVASLLLTRALLRRKEVAVRTALGAKRSSLIWQFLTESMLLAIAGGVLGIALSAAGTGILANLSVAISPKLHDIGGYTDWRVLGFALVLSLFTGVLFGIAPALQFSKTSLTGILREEGRGSVGGRSRSFSRNLLVTAQIGISVVLLVSAGLLIRSFIRLQTEPHGFDQRGVLTMHIALPPTRYATPAQMIEFYDRALESIRAIPGVEEAAASSALPLEPARMSPALIEGQPALPIAQRPILFIQTFTPSYLRAMRLPLVRGRFFTQFDKRDSLPVAVVNQALVNRFFGNEDPIGKHLWLGTRTAPAEIVGVIGDVKNAGLSEGAQPEIDVPFTQLPWAAMNLIVRTEGAPDALSNPVRLQIQKIDSEQPVTSIQTLEELLAGARSQPRTMMILLTIFAVAAFALAIIGLYGVISYSVGQRTQEVGIRIALGANHRDVVAMLVRQGAVLASIGIAAGLIASFSLTHLLTKLVYGVSTMDPLTFVLSPMLFMIFALLASYLPALRATKIDPAEALRAE